MRHLGILPGAPAPTEPITLLSEFHWVTSQHTGLFYPDLALGEHVTRGQRIGEIRDYFGRRLAEIAAPGDGILLFTVTTPATNPNDPLFAVGTPASIASS